MYIVMLRPCAKFTASMDGENQRILTVNFNTYYYDTGIGNIESNRNQGRCNKISN